MDAGSRGAHRRLARFMVVLASSRTDVAPPRAFVLDNFETLALRAPALVAATPGQDVFTSFAWFAHLYASAMADQFNARLLLVESDGGEPMACLPLAVPAIRGNGLSAQRLSSLSNYYSALFGPVVRDGAQPDREMCRAFARVVASMRPAFDVMQLAPLDASAPFSQLMREALASEGFLVGEYFCFGNWYLHVRGRTFPEYLAALPSALRNTVTRKEKALRRRSGFALRIGHDCEAELERAIADFSRVHANSWKQPEPAPLFVPGLCRLLAREGWLRIGVLRVDGEPIAAQIWIVKDGRALIYKLVYDQAHASLGAGSVLTKALIEHVIVNDHIDEIDYLTGDDAYKRDWMSDRRERHGLVAFNRTSTAGLILAARHFGGKAARRMMGRRKGFGASVRK